MKIQKFLFNSILFLLSIFPFTILSQENQDPTLSVGLESLTFGKGKIDVNVLTEIVAEKQKEIKDEALKRFILKLFPKSNYTTKFYIQNSLNILLNEKNPEVIEKEILELTTNYALTLGTAYAFYTLNDTILPKVKYRNYKNDSGIYVKDKASEYNSIVQANKSSFLKANLLKLEFELSDLKENLKDSSIEQQYVSQINISEILNESLEKKELQLFKIKQRRGISNGSEGYNNIKSIALELKNLIKKNDQINDEQKNELNSLLVRLDIEKMVDEIKNLGLEKSKSNKLLTSLEKFKIENIIKIDDNKITRPKIEMPFELVVDAVSAALSELKPLRDKGFFKNKIDYRNSQYYKSLSNTKEGIELKSQLDTLHNDIQKKVEPYILHYDVIKELIENTNFSDKDSNEIISELKNSVIKILSKDLSIIDNYGNNSLKNYLEIIDNNNDLIKLYREIKSNNNKLIVLDGSGKFNIEFLNNLHSNFNTLSTFNKNAKAANELKNLNANLTVLPIHDESFLQLNQHINIETTKLEIENSNIEEDVKKLIKEDVKKFNELIRSIEDYKNINDLKDKYKSFILSYDNIKSKFPEIKNLDSYVNVSFEKSLLDRYNKNIKEINSEVKIYSDSFPEKSIMNSINSNLGLVIEDDSFLTNSLRELSNYILDDKLKFKDNIIKETETVNRITELMINLYRRIDKLSRTNNFSLSDINYIDIKLKDLLIELELKDPFTDTNFNNKLEEFAFKISPLLKIKKLQEINGLGKYNESLLSLFEFIGNLNNLDKAETFKSIVDMLRTGSDEVEKNLTNDKFKDGYLVFMNAIKKNTLVNTKENYVDVDVVSF